MAAFQKNSLFVRRLLFTLLTACVIAAIVIQDHTSYLPLGVFNTGAATLAKIADACLAVAALVLILQLIELATGRLSGLGGFVRGVYVFVIILDVLLIFGDRLFVTGNPAGTLGQYYEVPNSGHPPAMLKKSFRGGAPAPCFSAADSTEPGPRILFLGDSYTEGSGSAPECNYPNRVERVLRDRWLSDAHVVNAGVSGYGPVEAASLLRWYRDRDCPVSAVVYNLTLQNDLADNLPGTERRVVAGIIFRFPRHLFLRAFHPLNTRVFRWVLVLVYFRRASTQDMLNAVSVAGGPCDLSPDSLTEVSPFLRATLERDLDNARRVAASPHGTDEAVRAIGEMRAIAHEMDVPFFLVVFPERVVADEDLRGLLGIMVPDVSARAHGFATTLGADRVLDVYAALAGRRGMYRTVDTHLSDLGNVAAGEYVGSALADYLKAMPLRPPAAAQ